MTGKSMVEDNMSKIKIVSRPFGEVEIFEDGILEFPEGIFAFEELKRYTLLSTKKNVAFQWLQSLEDSNVAFLVTDPRKFNKAYVAKVPKPSLELIGSQSDDELDVLCIITIPNDKPEQMTINLQGPILVNPEKKIAAQFVSEDESHNVRAPLLDLIDKPAK